LGLVEAILEQTDDGAEAESEPDDADTDAETEVTH